MAVLGAVASQVCGTQVFSQVVPVGETAQGSILVSDQGRHGQVLFDLTREKEEEVTVE